MNEIAALLLAYASRALLCLCRGETIPPFNESNSCSHRATEVLLVLGGVAQIALGVWGEAWVSPIGLLTAVYHAGTCSSLGGGLFNASWFIAVFEFAMMVLVLMYTLLWSCSAARNPTDDPTWLTVSTRGPQDASSGAGGNRVFSEQIRRAPTTPSPPTTAQQAAPNAFRGQSHTLDGRSLRSDGRTRRDRPSRSCS
jgi:hypothetical protein